jgi:uncharacterized protein (DUF2249 family)
MTAVRAPISPQDRVSDVLARDETLVDVFVRQAPHFAKLRNRAMRRIMARLITVEQAARTANIPVDLLVRELNAALGIEGDCPPQSLVRMKDRSSDDARQHPASASVVDLDVREDLRSGREPFSRIMSAVAALRDDHVLRLRTTFEPVPLFNVLGKRGFVHESEACAPDDWSVWFWRAAAPDVAVQPGSAPAGESDAIPPGDERTTYLDVRGSSPPEPLMRTLAALESLPRGRTLVQINNRVPQFLLPVLEERGFAFEIDDSQPDRVLVRISHAQ